MYYAGLRDTGGTIAAEIWKNVGGTATQIATAPVTPAQFPGSGTLSFTVAGSSQTLRINGVPVASATDTSIPGSGSIGLRATQGVVFDNFNAN
jgi:uncharacterized Zn-binding protein involved in type VI secretion